MKDTAHHSSHTPSYDSTTHPVCSSSRLAVSLAAHPGVAPSSSNTVQNIGYEWGAMVPSSEEHVSCEKPGRTKRPRRRTRQRYRNTWRRRCRTRHLLSKYLASTVSKRARLLLIQETILLFHHLKKKPEKKHGS